jgi:hypothetical protein
MKMMTLPALQTGTTENRRPALLVSFGRPQRLSALIAPEDFALITSTYGQVAWGVHGGRVVVGDPRRSFGRRSVAKIIAGVSGSNVQVAYRDGNPLNLLRDNIGIRRKGGVFWLVLAPGEADPVHYNGAFSNRIPNAILKHRDIVRPARATTPEAAQQWTQRGAMLG